MLKLKQMAAALAVVGLASPAWGASFVNGGFEDGTTNGWTTGAGYRAVEYNSALTPANYLPGGTRYNAAYNNHSAVVTQGIAPHTDGNLKQVYSGTYSFRAEDIFTGGYASAITQTVTNYTDANIYFAWAAVLQGAHGAEDAATFILTLRNDTTGTELVRRQYNAASGGGGVDTRFTLSSDNFYYTDWQIESLDVSQFSGDTFTLSLLAADCQQTGHAGYVYLDGFGAAPPPPGGVPVPGGLALLGAGALALGFARRKA